MKSVNWGRGFFRVWMLLSVLWMAAAITIGVVASINPYVSPQVVATMVGASGPEMFPTYGEPASVWSAAAQAGTMKATAIGDGFTLYTRADIDNQALADRLVEAKRLVNGYITSEKSARRTEYAVNTAFWALVLPIVLFILGWAIGWVLSGFRRTAA